MNLILPKNRNIKWKHTIAIFKKLKGEKPFLPQPSLPKGTERNQVEIILPQPSLPKGTERNQVEIIGSNYFDGSHPVPRLRTGLREETGRRREWNNGKKVFEEIIFFLLS
ncbi:MAG: hypothetical protein LH473_14070 [Chitinophagales bacterium]|nr:hypothetical protein [Chitinophagales bacterium]